MTNTDTTTFACVPLAILSTTMLSQIAVTLPACETSNPSHIYNRDHSYYLTPFSIPVAHHPHPRGYQTYPIHLSTAIAHQGVVSLEYMKADGGEISGMTAGDPYGASDDENSGTEDQVGA